MLPGFNFSKNKFASALAIDHAIPLSLKKIAEPILTAGVLTALLLSVFPQFLSQPLVFLSHPILPANHWVGILAILLSFRLILFSITNFVNSKTYEKNGNPSAKNMAERFNFYASLLWYHTIVLTGDYTLKGLMENLPSTPIGKVTLLRLGIFPQEYISAVNQEPPQDTLDNFLKRLDSKTRNKTITFQDFFTALFETQKSLQTLLNNKEITTEIASNTSHWIEKEFSYEDICRRWWDKERISRIQGFAKDWAYGKTPLLEKYTQEITFNIRSAKNDLVGREEEIKLLESALLKQAGANIIIVGEPGTGKHTLLLGLTQMISNGEIFPELEHKKVLKLDGASIVAAGKTKGPIQELLLKILNEAVYAGNIILAIENFPEFIDSLANLGINANEVFTPYLINPDIHILALADSLSFRRILENNAGLMKHFERIEISEPDLKRLTEILEKLVLPLEAQFRNKAFISYPALQKISEEAIQHLVEGSLPKRAVDLMQEVMEETVSKKIQLVTPGLVTEMVSRKTKMPLGTIKEDEQQKLLELETLLHKRVSDQTEAISAIADAIRRARSGIRNPNRPIGTFLFLGPTGVGKTETAKALAEIYFGSENNMLRFDMSEYQSEDGIERLIGSFQKNEPGILSSKMHSSPYSVVLLDEFEKSHLNVRNLFLQILDEGFFSDYLGRRVNMKNTIIIATSNAGSQLISELINKKVDSLTLREEIIAHIQKEKIISPELLNRFDSIIIFKPLNPETLQEISRMMLEKLAARLEKQNIKIKITDEIINYVTQGGFDPAWGARPIQRFIQDKIEKLIAEKIIKGEIKHGSEFTLSTEELKNK